MLRSSTTSAEAGIVIAHEIRSAMMPNMMEFVALWLQGMRDSEPLFLDQRWQCRI